MVAVLLFMSSLFAFAGQEFSDSRASIGSQDKIQACLDRRRINDLCKSGKIKPELKSQCPPPEAGGKPPTQKPQRDESFEFEPVNAQDIPRMVCTQGGEAMVSVRQALQKQIERCQKAPAIAGQNVFKFGCREFTRDEWCLKTNQQMLDLAMKSKTYAHFMQAQRSHFDWYRSKGALKDSAPLKKGDVRFTAYNAPLIEARSKPEKGDVPIYARPDDLVEASAKSGCGDDGVSSEPRKWCMKKSDGELAPYPERRDMYKHLAGKGKELGYLSPVEAYLLQVQGSGTLKMPDGKKRVLYAGQNGRVRHLAGRVIICAGGKLEGQDSIRQYFREHPEDVHRFLNYDNAYSFFEAAPPDAEIKGSEGIGLAPMSSVATDRSVIPSGAVMLFNVPLPHWKAQRCTGAAVAQDTGGAIVGAHVDWYMGEGEIGDEAGGVNFGGSLFVAVPKGSGKRIPSCASER